MSSVFEVYSTLLPNTWAVVTYCKCSVFLMMRNTNVCEPAVTFWRVSVPWGGLWGELEYRVHGKIRAMRPGWTNMRRYVDLVHGHAVVVMAGSGILGRNRARWPGRSV